MQASAHTEAHAHTHDAHHHEQSFLQKYVFSTDHKIIGIQYGLTALSFLLFGFCLMLCMRWQIAHPGQPIPIVGNLLSGLLKFPDGSAMAAGGAMSPDVYNIFGAMHGNIMVFLAVVTVVTPFVLFNYAALVLPAGYSAVLNATAPLFGVLAAAAMREERLTLAQASRLGEMDQFAFQSLLADREIPIHYGTEEFHEDVRTADALRRR